MLGFAMRAGRLVVGTEQVIATLAKRQRPCLVIISEGASEGTKRRLLSKCEFYNVESIVADVDAAELAALLGKSFVTVAVGVMDGGFAAELKGAIASSNN